MERRSEIQREKELKGKKQKDLVYQGSLISLYKEKTIFEDGFSTSTDLVKHPGAVAILPIDAKGHILFIKQYRRAIDKIIIEIPAGVLEDKEKPIDCAIRELREETGFAASTVIPLGGIFTAPGFCNEYIHIFLAKDLEKKPLYAEDTDFIDLMPLSLERALTMIHQGEIIDSKTLSAICVYLVWQRCLQKAPTYE